MQKIAAIIATCAGLGLLKPAPGTYGSLLALPLAWLVHLYWGLEGLIITTIAITIIGTWAAHAHAKQKRQKDPQSIIIDEVAGQMMTLWLAPHSLSYYFLGFILFRLFDITKPPPVRWIDTHAPGGFGIMADDIAAALYAMFGMWILISFKGGLAWTI